MLCSRLRCPRSYDYNARLRCVAEISRGVRGAFGSGMMVAEGHGETELLTAHISASQTPGMELSTHVLVQLSMTYSCI
jgi:hypothetical protein